MKPKEHQVYTLDQAFELLDCKGLHQFPTYRTQSTLTALSSEVVSDLLLSKLVHRMHTQEVKQMYARQSYGTTQQAIENVHSNLFVTDTAKIKENMKNAPYRYIKTIIIAMGKKRTLNHVFDRSNNR